MRARLLLSSVALALCGSCVGLGDGEWRYGGELQAYPTGVMTNFVATHPIYDEDDFTFRVGYNLTERDDYGEHDDESGGGPGLGIGAHHYFSDRGEPGWILGTRVDLWWLEIDWEDDARQITPARSGTTDVLVLQPVLETGYVWPGESTDLLLTVGLGVELNVDTDGEDVGEGAILLVGLRYVL